MIIYRDNIDPDKEILDILSDDEFNKRFYHEESNMITTFHNHYDNYKDLNKISSDFYCKIVEMMMKKFSLYYKSKYLWEGWFQVYNENTSGHEDHIHFSGHEMFSFVHFLSVTSQPCFYFLYDGEKQYVNEKSGDIIVFPSWATHGVDAVSSGKRKVFSGNVSFHDLRMTCDSVLLKREWENNILWTTIEA